MLFSASFDERSMKEIAAFAGFSILLTEEMQVAEQQLGDLIVEKTHDNAMSRFAQNSPGGLGESFVVAPEGLGEVIVGTNKPHGHRMDAGFVGADSLGRVYDEAPTLFFSDAITEVEESGEGMGILQGAVYAALGRMGA